MLPCVLILGERGSELLAKKDCNTPATLKGHLGSPSFPKGCYIIIIDIIINYYYVLELVGLRENSRGLLGLSIGQLKLEKGS